MKFREAKQLIQRRPQKRAFLITLHAEEDSEPKRLGLDEGDEGLGLASGSPQSTQTCHSARLCPRKIRLAEASLDVVRGKGRRLMTSTPGQRIGCSILLWTEGLGGHNLHIFSVSGRSISTAGLAGRTVTYRNGGKASPQPPLTTATARPPPACEQLKSRMTVRSVITPGTNPESSACRRSIQIKSSWTGLAGEQQLAVR